jgi:hypothetical protein
MLFFTKLFLVLQLLAIGRVLGWKRSLGSRVAEKITVGLLLAGTQFGGNAFAVECMPDCFKNCQIAAPGSKDYCTSTCKDYCDQEDRHDGLSGSVDGSGGETGLFGGSIDSGYVNDRPPKGVSILPDSLSKNYGIMKKGGSR